MTKTPRHVSQITKDLIKAEMDLHTDGETILYLATRYLRLGK